MLNNIIKTLKYKIQYGSIVEWYNFWYIILNKKHKFIPKVASIDDTIDKIIKDKCSVSRFGDGEVLLTLPNKELRFQKGNNAISKRLIEVLTSNESNHIVCVSDVFKDLYRYNYKARRFWRTNFFLYDFLWMKYLEPERQYYNTFITRPYMDFAEKDLSRKWFVKLKKIWDDRNIIFIEGEKSRLGIGNDLFDNANSIQRILCPPTNAFDKYEQILETALQQDKNSLFLIALGPTATVLAYDLAKNGRQAIDIGHVDVEYEWCRMGVTKKVPLTYKYVNESSVGNNVQNAGSEYENQIITIVK